MKYTYQEIRAKVWVEVAQHQFLGDKEALEWGRLYLPKARIIGPDGCKL